MSRLAPPRPPRPDDPVRRDEVEALVEALIEEARRRARRRRLAYAAVTAAVAFAGLAVFAILERGAQSQTPLLSFARSAVPAGAATSRIAFIREPALGGYGGVLWVMNPDGSGERRLTPAYMGVWSPDGKRIAVPGIFVVNADGSGKEMLTPDLDGGMAWSPDGRKIAFTRSAPPWYSCCLSDFEVYIMNADGSEQRRLTRYKALVNHPLGVAWSPDGRKLAFTSRSDGNLEIYVMNADGSEQRNLTQTPGWRETSVLWSPGQKS